MEDELGNRLRQYADKSKSPQVQLFIGSWFRRNGNNEEARQFFRAAKLADPGFEEADVALVEIDQAKGNFDSARSILSSLTARRDQDVRLRIQSAALESSARNYDQAMDQYRKVLAIDHDNLFALNNLAYLLANSNRPDEALAYAQQAQELSPNTAAVEDTLGWVLYRKGIYSAAVSHLEGAAQKSTDPIIQYHLGLALLKTGNRPRGEQILMSALKIAPNAEEATVARREMATSQ